MLVEKPVGHVMTDSFGLKPRDGESQDPDISRCISDTEQLT